MVTGDPSEIAQREALIVRAPWPPAGPGHARVVRSGPGPRAPRADTAAGRPTSCPAFHLHEEVGVELLARQRLDDRPVRPGPLPDEPFDDRRQPGILTQIPAERRDVLLQSIEATRVDVDDIPKQTREVIMQLSRHLPPLARLSDLALCRSGIPTPPPLQCAVRAPDLGLHGLSVTRASMWKSSTSLSRCCGCRPAPAGCRGGSGLAWSVWELTAGIAVGPALTRGAGRVALRTGPSAGRREAAGVRAAVELAGSHHRHHAHRFYLTGGYQDLPHRFGEQLDTEPPPG